MRGKRLNSKGASMFVVSETDLDSILAMVEQSKYDALVIDSIQTVFHPDVSSTPGSVTQIREAAMQFMRLAKTTGIPVFLVGKDNRHSCFSCGSCHQSWCHCRPENYGAHGGYGFIF